MLEIRWTEEGEARSARWRSENGSPPPARVVIADNRLTADAAHRLACEGAALLWRGDFHNARQLLRAMARRAARPPRGPALSPAQAFHLHRQARSQRARTLGRLLVPLDHDYTVPLRRAPDVRQACAEVYGPAAGPSVTSLRELLGIVGAHEWRNRGVERLVATDQDPRALACARDNLQRLGLAGRVDVMHADLFPPGRAPLVVCNPPWIPAKPASPLDHAVYDPGGRMLRGFLDGLPEHLEPGGEGWLILSDLAEHLALRTRTELLSAFATAGLRVVDRLRVRPRHPRALDETDPLHAARAAEVTSLWRLGQA
ncbi:methyltransferase [Streptosporangium roseum]|uniref:methyltransferase n=1 Tax=Streptosporangium roseum TaxID=2001 RepID=UPI0033232F64